MVFGEAILFAEWIQYYYLRNNFQKLAHFGQNGISILDFCGFDMGWVDENRRGKYFSNVDSRLVTVIERI